MPSFMPIGPKLWALEGYIHTDRQTYTHTDSPSFLYKPAPRTFQLALRGYSVASLPWASRFALARNSRFTLTKIFEKKTVSQSTQDALKRVKMQK